MECAPQGESSARWLSAPLGAPLPWWPTPDHGVPSGLSPQDPGSPLSNTLPSKAPCTQAKHFCGLHSRLGLRGGWGTSGLSLKPPWLRTASGQRGGCHRPHAERAPSLDCQPSLNRVDVSAKGNPCPGAGVGAASPQLHRLTCWLRCVLGRFHPQQDVDGPVQVEGHVFDGELPVVQPLAEFHDVVDLLPLALRRLRGRRGQVVELSQPLRPRTADPTPTTQRPLEAGGCIFAL